MNKSIYGDDDLVARVTFAAITATGSRLLQIHRFGEDDGEHANALLKIFNPAQGIKIADVGCGIGELALMMKAKRSDLEFLLINPSEKQLAMCPSLFEKSIGTAEDLPLRKGQVAAIMATYILGHVDLPFFVMQCRRVLGIGQKVYIYDLFKLRHGMECRIEEDLQYTERTSEDVISTFEYGGFRLLSSASTYFVPELVAKLMPSEETLRNSVSMALVFEAKPGMKDEMEEIA